MTSKDNVHPISDADLDAHRERAEIRMQNVPLPVDYRDMLVELRKLPGTGGYLLNDAVNHMLHVVRRGLCLYYELYDEVGAQVAPRQNPSFLGSFALFGMSALVAHELPAPEGEGLASISDLERKYLKVDGEPDENLKKVLWYYLRLVIQLSNDSQIESPDDLVNVTRGYFVAARDQMVADRNTHPSDLLAQVEGDTFRIGKLELRGFDIGEETKTSRIEFNPVLPDQVVGNSSAKRALLRYVDRLALYDAAQSFNPILELGGLPTTVLFDGFPGTGKTSLFRMAMTRLAQRGEQTGLPTHFELIDPGIKDEYYGKTGKLLKEKLSTTQDRGQLVLVFFDDIDLLLVSRDSGGGGENGSDKDVLTITMQFLDGIMTKNVGNYQTYAATNAPTATDSALRQRFHHRELISGPEDWDDYAALIGIKLARQLKRGLVQIPGELPTSQIAASSQDIPTNTNVDRQSQIANRAMSWRELGELCAEFKRKDPRFTGRPIESVTQKLLAESADFDVPETWFTDPTIYLQQPYEAKVKLLATLYRPITGEMIAAELERYFTSEQRYASDAKTQRAERVAADLEAQLAARELVAQRDGRQ